LSKQVQLYLVIRAPFTTASKGIFCISLRR